MDNKKIVVNGIEYVRADLVEETPGKLKIIVLPYGNVLVGTVIPRDDEDDDDVFVYSNVINIGRCAVIRKWGTTNGLGEIAKNGPTSATVLDRCPPVNIPYGSVIFFMDCDAKKWEGKL